MSSSCSEEKPAVLVVEDEEWIRLRASDIAVDCGLRVFEAANADDAIHFLEERSDIDIVFTDVEMPGSMDGIKLAHYIRGRWPQIKLIVASAKIRQDLVSLPEGSLFFYKPYQAAEISAALLSLLSG